MTVALFLVAWGGLAVCLAVAVGLTIRGRDRQVPTETPADGAGTEKVPPARGAHVREAS